MGVRGYDPILGSLSPPLRLCVHITGCGVLWSLVLSIWPEMGGWLPSGMVVLAVYTGYFYYKNHCQPGVSHPGGPRAHRIQRQPLWTKKDNDKSGTSLPWEAAAKWKFFTGRTSHAITEARWAGTSAALTGEPAGRDLWSSTDPNPTSASPKKLKVRGVDERVVHELASGGRLDGSRFDPSQNPNRYDRKNEGGQTRVFGNFYEYRTLTNLHQKTVVITPSEHKWSANTCHKVALHPKRDPSLP